MEESAPAARIVSAVDISGPAGRLEGLWSDPGGGLPAAVIGHPHPAHGGSMHNKVVHTVYRVLDQAGHPTLRFNFRGVGRSEGQYSCCNEELGDFAAAAAFARQRTGVKKIWVAGFSFGCWIGLQWALTDPDIARFIALGVPVENHAFQFLDRLPWPLSIVQGELDQYGGAKTLETFVEQWKRLGPVTYRIVKGADHFFTGKLPELEQALKEIL
jgi:alpha/beta superfamily hydrolase